MSVKAGLDRLTAIGLGCAIFPGPSLQARALGRCRFEPGSGRTAFYASPSDQADPNPGGGFDEEAGMTL